MKKVYIVVSEILGDEIVDLTGARAFTTVAAASKYASEHGGFIMGVEAHESHECSNPHCQDGVVDEIYGEKQFYIW